MSKLSNIKEINPEVEETPELVENAEAYDKLHALKALHDTEGGKVLVNSLVSDAVARIHYIRGGYATLTHQQLITAISQIDVYLDTAKALMNAADGMRLLDEQIEEALSE